MDHSDGEPLPQTRISGEGRFAIDLTGPRSHVLVCKAGVGSLSIGPATLGKKADLHVGAHERIDWSVFDRFATPSGSAWPRFIYYTGATTGAFEWAERRRIERLTWVPTLSEDAFVDARRAIIGTLAIELERAKERLSFFLPSGEASTRFSLFLGGDLARFAAAGDAPSTLTLAPRTRATGHGSPYTLPDMGILQQVSSLSLQNGPLAQPISLECVTRFPNLTSLSLHGAFSDLDQLATAPGLRRIALRFMPSVDGLPTLDAWPTLDSFIAWNIDEAGGKRLRAQVKKRGASRPWLEHASVTKLRKPEWWQKEFDRLFAAWRPRLAKIANASYDQAKAALETARSLKEAQTILVGFAKRFNEVAGIETTEREDLAAAVERLSAIPQATALGVTEEIALRWFNESRDY